MKNIELVTFDSEEALADAAASDFANLIATSESESTPLLVALSGGRVARRFFAEAKSNLAAKRADLKTTHFFWSDERCVPPDHAESNFAAANELLLAPLDISEKQIHRLQGEDPPASAAALAEQELRALAPAAASGQPSLDLVLLGMGEDGHVASLFPGKPETTMENPAVFRPVTAIKPPPLRLTLGYAAIAAARQVWVLASGAGKETALRNSLSTEGTTPLARVIKRRSLTKILTDIHLASA